MKFYKDRYIIAFYDAEDKFVDVFDNMYELMERTGKTYKWWSTTFVRTVCFFDGVRKTPNVSGRERRFCNLLGTHCSIHFISVENGCD